MASRFLCTWIFYSFTFFFHQPDWKYINCYVLTQVGAWEAVEAKWQRCGVIGRDFNLSAQTANWITFTREVHTSSTEAKSFIFKPNYSALKHLYSALSWGHFSVPPNRSVKKPKNKFDNKHILSAWSIKVQWLQRVSRTMTYWVNWNDSSEVLVDLPNAC